MKKLIFTTLAITALTTLASAFTLKDCYQHTTYYGEDKGYCWFTPATPVKLQYTVSGLENSPEFVSYIYDLVETYPGNYEWGTYELTFSDFIYPLLVTTEVGHGYGMEIDGYDANYDWYWNSTYDTALGYWMPYWSADENTVTFLNMYTYSNDFQIQVQMFGTPLPVAPIAMGMMSLFSVPIVLRRRKTA